MRTEKRYEDVDMSQTASDQDKRMACVAAIADRVFQSPLQSRRFLNTPHPEIGGRTPLDAALTESGARQAEEVMARILYCLPE